MAAKKPKSITELTPGSNDWLKAFDALSPQDQASIFNSQYDPTVSDFDYTFDEGVSGQPGVAGTGMGGAFPGASIDPTYQQLLQFGGGVNIPQLSAKGALEPYDLSQEAQRVNLMQDNASSIADIILSSLAGPGALDPASFAPVVTKPTDRVATPGLTQLDRYARGTGYKGYIAQKIKAGATDDEAIADLYNFLDTPDSDTVDPKLKALKQEVIDSLPSAFKSGNQLVLPSQSGSRTGGTGGGAGRESQDTRDLYDESAVSKWANDLYFKVADDQANEEAGWRDPDTGFLYSQAPTQEDSPATQKFKNLGLPTPFAAYDDPQYLQMAYDTMAPRINPEGAAWEQNVARTQAEQDRIGREARGPIDRNIATQKMFRDNVRPAGYQPRIPGPPSLAPGVKPEMRSDQSTAYPTATGPGTYDEFLNQASQSMNGLPPQLTGQAPTAPGAPLARPGLGLPAGSNFDAGLTLGSTWRPEGTKQAIRGIANPAGGFDFGGARPAEQQALGNAALNVFAAMPFGGVSGNRGTKVVPLNEATTKQSQADADAARKRFAQANTARFQATQALGADQANAITAWENARHAALRGSSPFKDAVMQRLLGQRAVGVRGI